MAWSEWKKFSEPSLIQTSFQFGTTYAKDYIFEYINNNCSKLSVNTSDSNARITVQGSNEYNGTYNTLVNKQNSVTDLDISGYKYIKLLTGLNSGGYGNLYTYNLSYS
jgi:hypothetical protein